MIPGVNRTFKEQEMKQKHNIPLVPDFLKLCQYSEKIREIGVRTRDK